MPSLVQYSTVYHVGQLDQPLSRQFVSHEGNGLSVSMHPDAWRQISGTVYGETWELTNPDGLFHSIVPSDTKPTSVWREWCISAGFVSEVEAYKAWSSDGRYVVFRDREDAEVEVTEYEAQGYDGGVEPYSAVTLDERGVKYWNDAFGQEPNTVSLLQVEGLLPVWYAEHALPIPVDGVWWEYTYNPADLSCPCGVIFQSRLDEWDQRVVG